MIAPVMIPLMIVGGFDGVEPQMTFKVCDRHGRAVGVREAARLTNMSPAHVRDERLLIYTALPLKTPRKIF